jgi:hypothetical protein
MAASPLDPPLKTAHPNALIDLEIPGSTGALPIPPAAVGETLLGINHGAAMDNFPEQGLQLYLPFWSQMSEGDSVKVLLDDAVVSTEVIEATEVGQRVTTFISAARLEPGPHTVKYVVSRVGQAAETSSETRIWVKLTRPGGQDQDGDTPGHSALKLTLPQDVINNGVDADTAEAGVPVTIEPYPDMQEGDRVTVSWGGRFVEHTVTVAEVDTTIDITVEKAIILEAGDSGANGLAVTYEVYDVVENRSEDWAAEIRVVVDTGNSRLSAPIVAEAVNNVLDLDKLGVNPVTVQVIAMSLKQSVEQLTAKLSGDQLKRLKSSMGKQTLESVVALKADFTLGDKIAVTLEGVTEAGEEVSYQAPEVIVDDLPAIYAITVPNAQIRKLAKTQAVFSYELNDAAGTLKAASKRAFINVIGEIVRMAAPVAMDAQQGALDPELPQTTVQIPWDDNMAAGDQITLKWIGTRPDQTIYDPALAPHLISSGEANSELPLFLTIAGTHLKAIDGGTLELYFLLEKDVNGTIDKRESARTSALNVGEARPELPAPAIYDVIDGTMDPGLAGTTMWVLNYTGKAIGDVVHALWKGSQSGEFNNSAPVNSFSLTNPIDFTIASTLIAPNDGGTVQASYWVIRAANGHRSDSQLLTFSVGKPVVLDPPAITGLTDSNGLDIPEGEATADTRVTLSGTAPASQTVELFDDAQSKGQVTAGADGTWMKEITDLAEGSHALKAKALYGDGAESAVHKFEVVASEVPTISTIKDSQGVLIPNGGKTYDTTVKLSGTAAAGLQVKVFANSSSKGTATADADGLWSLKITGMTVAAHDMKARALYGDGVDSQLYSFTVMLQVVPSIIDVKDSLGVVIPEGGQTLSSTVTLSGLATPGLQVEIFANGTSQGTATADTDGLWSRTITSMAIGAHAMKAKALYGDGDYSQVRSFTVIPSVAPTLDSIKDSSGQEIPRGGSTSDTRVTISGTASSYQAVEVFDWDQSKGQATADSDGKWKKDFTGLNVGSHMALAKALYGNGAESEIRDFWVVSPAD